MIQCSQRRFKYPAYIILALEIYFQLAQIRQVHM